jgi:acyl-coenzyme A synthetase/AMP-(fatty) acid ligase
VFIPSLSLTATGKIVRRELRTLTNVSPQKREDLSAENKTP